VGIYERRLVSTCNDLSEQQEELDELSFYAELLVVAGDVVGINTMTIFNADGRSFAPPFESDIVAVKL